MERDALRARGRHASLGVAAMILAAACSTAPPSSGPRATSAPTPSTSSPTSDRTGPALDAYRGMWQDFVDAGRTSDWQSPTLQQHAIGVALTNLSRSLYADHYNGLVTKGEPILEPVVRSAQPSADPTKVIVSDCGDSTHWLKYRADDGQPVGQPGGKRRITGVVEKQPDGSWKVSDYAVEGLGTC